MSADLRNLASRKLTVARQRAAQAQRELRETIALLQRLERENFVMFPWVAEKVQTQLLTDTQIQSADYLGCLQIAEITAKMNGELLRKSVESTRDWLNLQQNAVVEVRQKIASVTQKRDASVADAGAQLRRKQDVARDVGYFALPEKQKFPEGCLGMLIGAASGFFIGGIFCGIAQSIIEALFPAFVNALGIGAFKAMTVIPSIILFYFAPRILIHLLWQNQCKKAIAVAERHAQREFIEAQQRHPIIVATAEREFHEQMAELKEELAKAEVLESGAQDAHRCAEAHLAAPTMRDSRQKLLRLIAAVSSPREAAQG